MSALRVSLIVLAFASASLAQFDSGQISGFVRDQTGAVIVSSAVIATNEGSGEARKTATKADGYYNFPQLLVGTYSVSVEAAGFKKFLQTGIVLNAESKVRLTSR
jgi:Carboxypeptidase regulatory-like domain